MAPKGANGKKESGRAKKAENEANKRAAAEEAKERAESNKWVEGRERPLVAEEEASVQKKKSGPKAGGKKATKAENKPAGPGALAAGDGLAASTGTDRELSATGLDNALDLLAVVNAKTDKASVGNQAAGIERHPERRFKAAFNAYVESELPNIRAEQPGLRLQQYKASIPKVPENPFNQATAEYNATTEEKVEILRQKQDEIRERLRDKS
ncbi:hypothetical protein BGW80DRAFT_1456404 [Lactifluus volemus]|nr:hypothetical protein BGW80DRAFT_1456404 [Lactifluus volemus]